MFNKKKKTVEYEIPNKEIVEANSAPAIVAARKNLDTVADACTEHMGPMDEDEFDRVMKPSGHHKVNPIISIKTVDTDYPVIVNNETGESQNTNTYYGELLANVRTRAKCLQERKGLEYEVIMCDDTPEDQKVDLLMSNIEATDATLTVVLVDDILTCLKSVACNIEGKILQFMESHGISGSCYKDIVLPEQDFLIGMFSYRYPNRSIETYTVSASTYFDFVANRELQIMNNYCGEVYNFVRSVAYDPTIEDLGAFEQYPGAHDSFYVCLCDLIYNDLACLDDALRALITAHCVRIENCYTPARDAYKAIIEQNRKPANLPSQTKK